jgi:glycosyltransferase involved in cell wall biosynthesis
MKILRIIISLDPAGGGPAEGIRRLTEALARAGHTQEVVVLDAPDAPFLADFPGKVHALGRPGRNLPQGGGKIWERFGFTPGAARWVKENRDNYDAVIVSGLWNYGTAVGRFGLSGYDKPVLVFVHGMLAPWLKEFNSSLKHWAKQASWLVNEGVLLNRSDRVLFTSEEEMITARDSFRPYRLRERVVSYGTGDAPYPIDSFIKAFKARVPNVAHRRFFLFLSRIYPKKGCDLLISSFAKYAARMPNYDLVIAGPDQIGWTFELQEQAARLGISDRIHWPGMVTGDAKWGAYHACEAFVLPSHHENFGIVVAEAMACAKPLLISNKINIWRETEEYGASIVESDTAHGTDRLFERYLELSEAQIADMGKSSRQCFLERFHIDNVAADLIELVKQVQVEKSSGESV